MPALPPLQITACIQRCFVKFTMIFIDSISAFVFGIFTDSGLFVQTKKLPFLILKKEFLY